MTASQICTCRSCLELFPEGREQAEERYRMLMRQFHPDICRDSQGVRAAAVINSLYHRIRTPLPLQKKRLDTESGTVEISYLREYPREDGIMYFGENAVWYVLDDTLIAAVKQHLYQDYSGMHMILEQKLPDDAVRHRAKTALPQIEAVYRLTSGALCLQIQKEPEELPLEEVLSFFGKTIDVRHCAWMISRLLDLCCIGSLGGIVWNSLCTANLLVHPAMHTLRLTGGWWFSAEAGSRMIGAQSEVYDVMPTVCRTDGIARPLIDLECVRAVCRKIFPERAPQMMVRFSDGVCAADAFAEIQQWEQTIISAFGGRYFTPMVLCTADIYTI